MIDKPTLLQLETSTACDAKCVFCPHKDLKRRGGMMSELLFRKIIAEAADVGIGEILLFLNGEPLLFPKLLGWLELLRERELKTTIFTNAASLTREKGRQLLKYADVIRGIAFSLGGVDERSYQEVMGLDFNTVRENVLCFLDINDDRIPVEAHIPLMSLTKPFMDIWVAMWGNLMTAAPTAMFNFAGSVTDEIEHREDPAHRRQACPRLHHMTVLWDGCVCLCCMDAEGQIILGDMNNQSIMEVFEGEKALYYRTVHAVGEFDELPLCKDCNMNILGVE